MINFLMMLILQSTISATAYMDTVSIFILDNGGKSSILRMLPVIEASQFYLFISEEAIGILSE